MNHTKLSKSEKKDAFARKYSIYGSITYYLLLRNLYMYMQHRVHA